MRFDLVASIRSARGPMIKRFRPVAAPYSDGDRPLTCLRARRRDKYERAPAVKRSSLADLRSGWRAAGFPVSAQLYNVLRYAAGERQHGHSRL
jgi:anti-sigma factor RsiW